MDTVRTIRQCRRKCGSLSPFFQRTNPSVVDKGTGTSLVIRVVLVKEDHGWYAFFCTDPNASVKAILEAFADRATIEQDFHDVN